LLRSTVSAAVPDAIVVTTILVVVLASPLLWFLPFDFNPLHLRNPKVESVATFLELRKDPQAGANAIEIIAPDLSAADATAKRLASLPQVAQRIRLAGSSHRAGPETAADPRCGGGA